MPYFPKPAARHYRCQGCGGEFTQPAYGGMSCSVAHAPGTCCHYGEKTPDNRWIGPDGKPHGNERPDQIGDSQ